MQKLEVDENFRRVMDTLAQAWTGGHKVRISYQALGRSIPRDRVIRPHFIQPVSLEHGNYVVAFCEHSNKVLTFKAERISGIELLDEKYEVPADFDANEHFGSAWGVTVYGKPQKVRLKFNTVVGRIAQETHWHPSQTTKMQPDGTAVVTFLFINFPL